MKRALQFLTICLALACSISESFAERGSLPYQGTLKQDGRLYTGAADLKFEMWDGGAVLWSSDEVDKKTDMPRRSVSVTVADGRFSVILGTPPMPPLDIDNLRSHPYAILRVWVSTNGQPFEQLSDQTLDRQGRPENAGVPGAVWSLKGNRGTDPLKDFLGTTDDSPLIIKTNGTPGLTLGSDGQVEVHKSLIVRGNARVDENLSVTGNFSTAGEFSLSGPLSIAGDANIGGNAHVAGGLTVGLDASCKTLTILGGSDLAEPFEVGNETSAPPGTVMCIDPSHEGHLVVSRVPYDRMVAGVVSGANGVRPGLIMSAKGNPAVIGTHNLALSGRVYVRATASNGPIRPGDLLTTAETPGHAMRAANSRRARGAVMGKAMSSLGSGTGFVLLLVQPQ